MKISIEIDCTDDDEALTHLSVIRATIKKKFKELAKYPDGDQANDFEFYDSNCYGIHQVNVYDL
jgi:hypothetical protein